ncbi:MAG: radical SAM protein [Betaproteobacteria bacterium]
MDEKVYTICPEVPVSEFEGQYVLVNPKNLEWIKLTREAYELAENSGNLPATKLVALECALRGADSEEVEGLLRYLLDAGFIVEAGEAASLGRVYFNVTDRCNLSCPACYFAAGDGPGAGDLSTDEALSVLDVLATGKPRCLVVSGGEPFLRDDIGDILAFATRRFDDVVLLTNGCLIGEKEARLVKECGARVQVSIESDDPATHELARGRGSFGSAMRGIRALRSAGVGGIEIVPTLTRRNLARVQGIIKLARELGVGYHFSLFVPVGRGACHAADLSIAPRELLACFASLVKRTCQDSKGWSKGRDPGPAVDLRVKVGCGAGYSVLSVGPDGAVYPCPLMHRPEMLLGRLPGSSLSKIRRAGKSVVPEVNEIPGCSQCKVAYFCGGGCRAHALAQGGSLLAIDPYCEFYKTAYLALLSGWRDDRTIVENARAVAAALAGGL